MTELELKIQEAAQKYYTDGTSDLTDEEFDALVEQLKHEQPNSLLFRVGWGYDVSSDSTPGIKRKHLYTTIGSLEKCHNLKELGKDLVGVHVDISTKLDGLSCVLYYESSLLKYALTRGDSFTGIDITDKVLKINPAFARTKVQFTGAIRGEILMTYTNFEKFKQIHLDAKNPRNSTAGLINGKDTFEDLPFLDIVLYTLVYDDFYKNQGVPVDTSIHSTRNFIYSLFNDSVKIVPHASQKISYTYTDNDLLVLMEELKSELYENYPADGLVVSKENINAKNGSFNYTAKAFKFPAESKITKIIDIEWNMSKTKNAVPRVLLEPVQLSGATVTACAGYHAQYIKENNLGPGSIIEVRRSGEVIPQIINIIESTKAELPENCPDCHCALSWNGVHLVCTNENCSNSMEQDLLVWLQNLVPLDNLGDTLKMKFINQLVDNNSITDCSIESVMECKLHLLEDTPSVQFNNFAKMWNNLHDSSFKFDLVHALIACNIPRIGDLTAIKFANHPDIIQEILDINGSGEFPLLVLTSKIGEANAWAVFNHINKIKRLNIIRDRIIWKNQTKVAFKGKVAITGTLSVKRSEFEKELRANGYEPTNTVNKDTKFLITLNPDGQSSKNLAATKFGVTKITEYDFRLKYMN